MSKGYLLRTLCTCIRRLRTTSTGFCGSPPHPMQELSPWETNAPGQPEGDVIARLSSRSEGKQPRNITGGLLSQNSGPLQLSSVKSWTSSRSQTFNFDAGPMVVSRGRAWRPRMRPTELLNPVGGTAAFPCLRYRGCHKASPSTADRPILQSLLRFGGR
jgi:hypothetical protein